MAHTNHARCAGQWYPDDPAVLAESIAAVEAHDRQSLPRAAVLPHAGLSYSARGIGRAFPQMQPGYSGTAVPVPPGVPTRVLILSPSHYVRLAPDHLYSERFERHETPLGFLKGDTAFAGALANALPGAVEPGESAIEMEHGSEIFLPFLRRAVPDARISILLVPEISNDRILLQLATGLMEALVDERVFLIMSSDFTHYGRRFHYTPWGEETTVEGEPGSEAVSTSVEADDRRLAEWIAAGNRKEVWNRLQRPVTVCGRYPVLLGMAVLELIAPERVPGQFVDYYSSRTVTGGSKGDFVCYGTILFE